MADSPPHLLFVLLDDVPPFFYEAWDEINPYDFPASGQDPRGPSHLYVEAPVLERLRSEGITYTNAYANPVCSNDRACALTGMYPHRHGVGNTIRGPAVALDGELVALGERPIGKVLAQVLAEATAGRYVSGLIGKWHLTQYAGPASWRHIDRVGRWDEHFVTFHNLEQEPAPAPLPGEGPIGNYLFLQSEKRLTAPQRLVRKSGTFSALEQFRQATDFCLRVTRDPEARFLCALFPNAVHAPWELPQPTTDITTTEYKTSPPGAPFLVTDWRHYCATLEYIDTCLGRLLSALPPAVRANTMVVFGSDNGGPSRILRSAVEGNDKDLGQLFHALRNDTQGGAPNSRFKGSVYEGGVRVPLVISGPLVAPGRRGSVSPALFHTVDFLPTLAGMAGMDTSNLRLDGVDQTPTLHGNETPRADVLTELFLPNGERRGAPNQPGGFDDIGYSRIFRGGDAPAIAPGRYKLIRRSGRRDELYHLQRSDGSPMDPWEQSDLAADPAFRPVRLRLIDHLREALRPWGA